MKNVELMSYIGKHVSPDLFNRMGKWLEDNPTEVYWDYDDELSKGEIDMLLDGDRWQFIDNLHERIQINEYYWNEERDRVRECMWEFMDEILGGITVDQDDIEGDDIWDINEELELHQFVWTKLNEKEFVQGTRVRLTLDLGLDHPYIPTTYYDEAEEILEFFNINPRTMYALINGSPDKWLVASDDDEPIWPDIPERNGHEFVDPKYLLDSWYNMPYSGEYIALLGGSLDLLTLAYAVEEAESKDKYLELTLRPGTRLLTHAYWPGSSGTFFALKKEMKIRITNEYQLARDGRFKYGVDDVFGTLDTRMWDQDFGYEVKVEMEEEMVQ